MKCYIKEIIVPYLQRTKEELHLPEDHSVLVIFDAFKGQYTENMIALLEENNIEHVLIPANCTDQLQLLDLSVNKSVKEFLRGCFQEWYSSQISKHLDEGTKFESADLRLSVMKPSAAHWLVEFHDYFRLNPSIIINGFREAGILSVLGLGSS